MIRFYASMLPFVLGSCAFHTPGNAPDPIAVKNCVFEEHFGVQDYALCSFAISSETGSVLLVPEHNRTGIVIRLPSALAQAERPRPCSGAQGMPCMKVEVSGVDIQLWTIRAGGTGSFRAFEPDGPPVVARYLLLGGTLDSSSLASLRQAATFPIIMAGDVTVGGQDAN